MASVKGFRAASKPSAPVSRQPACRPVTSSMLLKPQPAVAARSAVAERVEAMATHEAERDQPALPARPSALPSWIQIQASAPAPAHGSGRASAAMFSTVAPRTAGRQTMASYLPDKGPDKGPNKRSVHEYDESSTGSLQDGSAIGLDSAGDEVPQSSIGRASAELLTARTLASSTMPNSTGRASAAIHKAVTAAPAQAGRAATGTASAVIFQAEQYPRIV